MVDTLWSIPLPNQWVFPRLVGSAVVVVIVSLVLVLGINMSGLSKIVVPHITIGWIGPNNDKL